VPMYCVRVGMMKWASCAKMLSADSTSCEVSHDYDTFGGISMESEGRFEEQHSLGHVGRFWEVS
jgi:hypothetical protein